MTREKWGGRMWLAVLASCLCVSVAAAQDAEPTAQQRQAAADAFDRGTAAFLAHDYPSAAQWFETANRMAPAQPALLWAIKAHSRAGDTLRAATLALRLRTLYGEGDHATERTVAPILEAADHHQVRVDVTCTGCTLDLDGTLQESNSFYLEPGGDHSVVAHFETGDATQSVTGAAGDHRALTFDAPAAAHRGWPATHRTPTTTDTATPPHVPEENPPSPVPSHTTPDADHAAPHVASPSSHGGGLSPVVFAIGAGLTAVSGAFLIGFAADMYGGVGAYVADPTLDGYNAGHDKEIRTDAMIGVTVGLAAATVVIAILTDWGGGHADAAPAPVTAVVVPVPGGATAAAVGTF